MKFGESLSEGLVPEWKDQYLNYKLGKKLIKKVDLVGNEQSEGSQSNVVGDAIRKANDRTPLLDSGKTGQQYNKTGTGDAGIGGKGEALGAGQARVEENEGNDKKHLTKGSILSSFKVLRDNKSNKSNSTNEKDNFRVWLDSELDKVDTFFKTKERDLYERFLLFQDQFYQLKEHKAAIYKQRRPIQTAGIEISEPLESDKVYNDTVGMTSSFNKVVAAFNKLDFPSLPSAAFLRPAKPRNHDVNKKESQESISLDENYHENRVRNGFSSIYGDMHGDETSLDSEANSVSTATVKINDRYSNSPDSQLTRRAKRRDYAPKKQHFGVSYLYAKRQLREALLEHYRGLSLLKSYRVLNRTAFRKITKKFDKATHAQISQAYMEKVDKESYFQTSDILDKLTTQSEELYIIFFDNGSTDRKHSLEKLRSIAYALNNSDIRKPTFYSSFFSSGLLLGFGFPLFVLALYVALRDTINGSLPEGKFLLQIWGGFFLINLVVLLFGVNLYVFNRFKINYKFIFEFNISSALDFRQYFLLPSFSFAFLSLIAWFSLNNFWPHEFPGRDWPWIYFGVMLVLFFWPGRQFYYKSRRWLQTALWRLLLSGFYPVEFRDFFLGDILCSLTYTLGNVSFFFCLYSHHWNGILHEGHTGKENVCGSSKSRSMGFFSSLPSIWRLLQCIRRYMDTGDWFPHLANMLKYGISTIYYCLLSVYRIDRLEKHRIVFIVFAALNSIFSSSWDILMDWSLFQIGSKNFLLRDNLFYKEPMLYYVAIVLDIILRFQWIFYAFFTNQVQQLAVTSFCIALAELVRRFIWIFFRMENEHSTNVTLFRASRDTPLPYSVPLVVESSIKKLLEMKYEFQSKETAQRMKTSSSDGPHETVHETYTTPGSEVDEESAIGTTRSSKKTATKPYTGRRSTFSNITDAIHKAHIKDFERRKTKAPVDEDFSDEDDDMSNYSRSQEDLSRPAPNR